MITSLVLPGLSDDAMTVEQSLRSSRRPLTGRSASVTRTFRLCERWNANQSVSELPLVRSEIATFLGEFDAMFAQWSGASGT